MTKTSFSLLGVFICFLIAAPAAPPVDRASGPPSPLAAETRTVVGPPGGWMRGLALSPADPKEVFVVSWNLGQVFRSKDGGASWTSLASFEDTLFDVAVAPTDPNRVYVLGSKGVFVSGDRGVTWKNRRFGANRWSKGQIVVHLKDADIVFVSGYYNYDPADGWASSPALFQSHDGGKTWAMTAKFPDARPGSLTILAQAKSRPAVLYAGGYYYRGLNYYPSLWRVENDGRTWKTIYPPGGRMDPAEVVVDPEDPDRVFTVIYKSVWRSLNGGKDWTESPLHSFLTVNQFLSALAMDPGRPSALYASADGVVLRTLDGGDHWTRVSDLVRTVYDFLPAPGGLLAATRTGLYRSIDKGGSWKAGHTGLNAADVVTLATGPAPSTGACPEDAAAAAPASSHVIYAGVAHVGLYRSADGGDSWVKKWAPHLNFKDVGTVAAVMAHPLVPDTVFALLWECGFTGIYRSVDGGATLTKVSSENIRSMVFSAASERSIRGTGRDFYDRGIGFFASSDGGKTWQTSRPLDYPGYGIDMAAKPGDARTLLIAGYTSADAGSGTFGRPLLRRPDAGGNRAVILKTSNGGISWTDGSQGLQGTILYAVSFDPKTPDRVLAAGDRGVFKSENAGVSWVRVLTGDFRGVTFLPGAAKTFYAGGPTGLFVSRDGGKTWKDSSEGMMVKCVQGLDVDAAGKALYVGLAGGSIFKIAF
jgi:photosystem II stability/assembly factor-like uncharacterized protein